MVNNKDNGEEKNQQELIFKLSMFEQQIRNIQEQLQAVEQSILELEILNNDLDSITGSADREMMAPVGRGIFVRGKITSEDLIVDIGGKNLVKKSVPETKKIILEQIEKLKDVKEELENGLEKLSAEFGRLINEAGVVNSGPS